MMIFGHRGASFDHAENTIPAFLAAIKQGADGVELDVRRTSDGVLVVHHDPALPDGRVICDIRRTELPELVPTLLEALVACGSLIVNIEIKNTPDEPGFESDRRLAVDTLALLDEMTDPPRVIVSSFDFATIEMIKATSPRTRTGYLVMAVSQPVDAIARCLDGGHDAVHPWDPFVDAVVVDQCHEAGLDCNVWTVDDPDRLVQLASWRADGVVTNRPALARSTLG